MADKPFASGVNVTPATTSLPTPVPEEVKFVVLVADVSAVPKTLVGPMAVTVNGLAMILAKLVAVVELSANLLASGPPKEILLILSICVPTFALTKLELFELREIL